MTGGTPEASQPEWRLIGESVKGASHVRGGKPNQDAIAWAPIERQGVSVVLAVADGHGSVAHPRSEVGSRLAVKTAIELLDDFLRQHGEGSDFGIAKQVAEVQLPALLERRWKEAVGEHLRDNPPDFVNSPHQGEPVPDRKASAAPTLPFATTEVSEVDPARYIPYGTTVVAAAVSQALMLFLQIGDGDILVVTDSGEVVRPLPRDERLLGNETTSLCMPRAKELAIVRLLPLGNQRPAMIMLSTDGYSNSYESEDEFKKVATDYLHLVHTLGPDAVQESLKNWLSETTTRASGDDITLGLIISVKNDELETLRKKVADQEHRLEQLERAVIAPKLGSPEPTGNHTDQSMLRQARVLLASAVGLLLVNLAGTGFISYQLIRQNPGWVSWVWSMPFGTDPTITTDPKATGPPLDEVRSEESPTSDSGTKQTNDNTPVVDGSGPNQSEVDMGPAGSMQATTNWADGEPSPLKEESQP